MKNTQIEIVQNYVVGFVVDKNFDKVLLLQKNRPSYLAGLWNGLGGKIEGDEPPEKAMRRECREESSLDIQEDNWFKIGDFNFNGGVIYIYTALEDLSKARQMESEKIKTFYWNELDNLKKAGGLIEFIKAVREYYQLEIDLTKDNNSKKQINNKKQVKMKF